MKAQHFAVVLLAVMLSGCFEEKGDVVCDAQCRSEASGEAEDFPSLDTSPPDSFKAAPSSKGQ